MASIETIRERIGMKLVLNPFLRITFYIQQDSIVLRLISDDVLIIISMPEADPGRFSNKIDLLGGLVFVTVYIMF